MLPGGRVGEAPSLLPHPHVVLPAPWYGCSLPAGAVKWLPCPSLPWQGCGDGWVQRGARGSLGLLLGPCDGEGVTVQLPLGCPVRAGFPLRGCSLWSAATESTFRGALSAALTGVLGCWRP